MSPQGWKQLKRSLREIKRFLEPRLLPKQILQGRGGGQVVSVLSFYSDITSSNPADVFLRLVRTILQICFNLLLSVAFLQRDLKFSIDALLQSIAILQQPVPNLKRIPTL